MLSYYISYSSCDNDAVWPRCCDTDDYKWDGILRYVVNEMLDAKVSESFRLWAHGFFVVYSSMARWPRLSAGSGRITHRGRTS